jgi:MFS family permease
LCAFTGGHVINYSVIIYSQETLKSDLLSGIGFGLCFGPPLVLGWFAGVLCDRLAPSKIIHSAQAVFILAAAVLASGNAFISQPSERAPVILSAAFLAGVGWSFAAPARMMALGQVVQPSELKQASLLFNLFVMLGFGLGPLSISACRYLVGWEAAFALAAILFTLASLLLLGVKTVASEKAPRRVMEEVAEGLRAAAGTPLIAQLLLSAIVGYTLMGPMQVLLPKLAHSELALSELERGAFLGTLAPSLIVGGVLCLLVAARFANGKAIFLATALSGILFALLGSMTVPGVAVVVLACIGACGGIAIGLIVAGIQANVEESVRGRVLAMYTIISQFVPAASGLVAGILTHFLDVRRAAMICGAFLVTASVANALWMRALHGYRGH